MSLDKTVNSYIASLYPGVNMGTDDVNARGDPAMDLHSFRGGQKILLVALCYTNRDKQRPDWPLCLYADLTYLIN